MLQNGAWVHCMKLSRWGSGLMFQGEGKINAATIMRFIYTEVFVIVGSVLVRSLLHTDLEWLCQQQR